MELPFDGMGRRLWICHWISIYSLTCIYLKHLEHDHIYINVQLSSGVWAERSDARLE